MSETIISPSMLSADFSNLINHIDLINRSRADWFHLDIMDGRFVPNITFGFPVIKSIKKYAEKPLDVHLMIVEPEKYLSEFKKSGADILTVHYEACTHLHRAVEEIKQLGMKAGVSLNPHTPVSVLSEIVSELDLVLIMSVNPGFGGQKFIENSYSKIGELKNLIIQKKSTAIIEVDGGVDSANARRLKQVGAQALVAGSFIFGSSDISAAVDMLKNA